MDHFVNGARKAPVGATSRALVATASRAASRATAATTAAMKAAMTASALAAALAVALPATAYSGDRPLAPVPVPTISVTGEGRAEAVPDMASIRIGIMVEAPTAAEALAQASEAVRATLALLDDAGIAARDRQTTGLSLNPNRDYGRTGNGPARITGYTAQNGVTVRVRDLSMLGALLDLVVSEGGANRLDGLSFSLADPAPLRDAARRDAVADARRRAELYAEAAGVRLGPVLAISDGAAGGPVVPLMRADMVAMSEAAVPIAEGEIELTARVQMVFAIAE